MRTTSTTISIVAIFFILLNFTQVRAQQDLSAEAWLEDLKEFQQTIHTDYSFLFKKITTTEFDAEVDKLAANIPQLEDHEVMVGFLRLISLFEYGHTDMSFEGSVVPHHRLPINLYEYKDGMYIEGGHQSHSKAIGAKVIAIEGMPIAEALEKIRPTVPEENKHYFKAFGINNLLIPEIVHAQRITPTLQNEISFTLEKEGTQFPYTMTAWKAEDVPRTEYSRVKVEGEWVSARDQSVTPMYLKNMDKVYYYEYLPEEKTVYVRHSKIRDDASENTKDFYGRVFKFIEENDVEKFILDVRLNGGGNNYLNKPIITGVIETKKINQPGKFITIIGRRTFSAAQNLINRLDNYTNVTFIGEMSSENINFYGDARRVTLPNSQLTLQLSFAWWQDKAPWENRDGMMPRVPVMMTFDEYVTNQDPELQAALEYGLDDKVTDPMDRLTELFIAGKFDEVQAEAQQMVNNPAYSYYDFENEFINAGDRLVNNGNLQGGMFVLNLVADLFPKSAKVWLSLGKGYEVQKDHAKAKELYTKVIQMDPNGSYGVQAKALLNDLD